ncbi:MAG: DUF2851 family protein [Flavobacteriaceae bacterium]|nr:DUF2851 family protein [Flavobacteriaceae bacterium]
MKENVLHYLWLHKKIDARQLVTTKGESLQILNFGQYLETAGPDFFNAQIVIGNQKWAGNVEMHVKSSDWYLHHHEKDNAYNNVILHVVWEHDQEVFYSNDVEIPVLELKKSIDVNLLTKIDTLFASKSWINCEKQINMVSNLKLGIWKERLFFERLEEKSKFILEIFENQNRDWEATCFIVLAKNFGLNINGNSFLELFSKIPFSVIRKESGSCLNLEALFFGSGNFLNNNFEDNYAKELKEIWNYQKAKYKLLEDNTVSFQFYKLRPDNFPTIRIAQLSALIAKFPDIFIRIIEANDLEIYYKIFDVVVSKYWLNHFNFDKSTKNSNKRKLSREFIQLLIINTILPLKYVYVKQLGLDFDEDSLALIKEMKKERNSITSRFEEIGISNENAFDSQALLHLKQNYCNKNDCLKCSIGLDVLGKI